MSLAGTAWLIKDRVSPLATGSSFNIEYYVGGTKYNTITTSYSSNCGQTGVIFGYTVSIGLNIGGVHWGGSSHGQYTCPSSPSTLTGSTCLVYFVGENATVENWLRNNATRVTTYDLRPLDLSVGQHTVAVTAKATNYIDSVSTSLTIDVYASSATITGGSITNVPNKVFLGDSFSGVVTADSGKVIPTSSSDFTISGGTFAYDPTDGSYTMSNVTGTVSIAATCLTTLGKVTNVALSAGTLSFNSVPNATDYEVYSDGTLIGSTSTTSVDIATLTYYSTITNGAHSLTIVATAIGYGDGEPSDALAYNKLDVVKNEAVDSSYIYTFTGVANASSYAIYVMNNGVIELTGTTSSATFDLTTLSNWGSLVDGSYTVKAISNGVGTYTPSSFSTGASFTKTTPVLATPSIALDGTDLLITDNDGNATSFDLYDGNTYIGNVVKDEEASGYTLEYESMVPGDQHPDTLTITYADGTTGQAFQGNTYSHVASIDDINYGGANYQSYTIDGVVEPPLPYILSNDVYVSSYSECFVENTQITLADGSTKAVQDITYDDDLLVYDFYEGKLASAKPIWIMKEKVASQYKKVTLSDGTILKLVGTGDNCHRLFNVTKQKFLYANECVGDEVYKQDGSIVKVLSCEKINEEVKYYNLTTDKYLDCFAEGVLTGSRLNNMYHISNMKYDSNERLISEEEEAQRWLLRKALKK